MRPPHCTLCGDNMQYLGVGHSTPPFWSQMQKFFAYPFRANGLIFLALIALLTAGTVLLFERGGLLAWIAIFIVASLIVSQGLKVIEFGSQGKTRPPSLLELFDGNPATLKMIGLMLAYVFGVGALSKLGLLGVLAIFGLSVLLPASIMLLAISGSLLEAINPIQTFNLASKIGWSYLGLVLVLLVISAGPDQALGLLSPATLQKLMTQSPHLLFAMLAVSTCYFNMVMGAMMGYLLFQNHSDLGITLDAEHEVKPTDKRTLDLARAAIFLRESRFDDALRQLGGMLSDFPDDVTVHERYHKLLCESGQTPERISAHTENYLDLLCRKHLDNRLLPAFETTRRVIPTYRPKRVSLRIAVAEACFRQHQHSLAVALLERLHTEAPTSEDLPAAYYLLARVYAEGIRNDDKALMVLDYVHQHFPGHALFIQIDNYRKVVLSLKSASSTPPPSGGSA
jgi:predicted Zn-dependent protease